MSAQILDKAIKDHNFRPRGIKIGTDLWKELNDLGRVKWKRGYLSGVVDSGIDLPVIDEDIFVHVDPALPESGYELPQKQSSAATA